MGSKFPTPSPERRGIYGTKPPAPAAPPKPVSNAHRCPQCGGIMVKRIIALFLFCLLSTPALALDATKLTVPQETCVACDNCFCGKHCLCPAPVPAKYIVAAMSGRWPFPGTAPERVGALGRWITGVQPRPLLIAIPADKGTK